MKKDCEVSDKFLCIQFKDPSSSIATDRKERVVCVTWMVLDLVGILVVKMDTMAVERQG